MDTIDHPCFNYSACKTSARIHLPVAPDCNIQCCYCNRDYDCANEIRPGVTSKILTPEQAFEKFTEASKKLGNITTVGFAGPGDPLANWKEVKQTAELVRSVNKTVNLCISTNGLNLPKYSDELVEAGFAFLTITINAVKPTTAAKIYQCPDIEELLKNQLKGLKYLSGRGIKTKINTIYLPGINDGEIEDIARTVSENGAFIMNIKNVIPSPSPPELNEIRRRCSKYIKQMDYCKQCRADSVGLLGEDRFSEFYQVPFS